MDWMASTGCMVLSTKHQYDYSARKQQPTLAKEHHAYYV